MVLAGIAVAIAFGPRVLHAARSAQPAAVTLDAGFDEDQSAALFVGVRNFRHPELTPVRYAADDAVDLAYLFVFDSRAQRVRPDRVVIALSGDPEKEESKEHLKALLHAGATRRHADQTDIVVLLKQQARLAGNRGLLIVSVATHGYVRNGIAYVLGASSNVRYPATAIPVPNILDIAALSAGRSLVLIDACRERLSAPTRSATRRAKSVRPLLPRMSRTHGQAVFAAATGEVTYEGVGNGVFTKAVIEGLQCGAAKPEGSVRASTLGTYVQNKVARWVHEHIGKTVRSAIQLNIDGDASNMPLSQCWPDREVRFATTQSCLRGLDAETNKQLWEKCEGTPLRAMAAGDLFRDHWREAAVLWGGDATRLAIYSAKGERLSYCDLPERLDHVAVGRPTNHHASKIVVAGKTTVMVFDPKKVDRGKPLWAGVITPHSQSVKGIEIRDGDGDGKDEISIKTANGTLLLDFKGNVIARHVKRGSLHFHLLHSRRTRP